ncbi:flavin reductase family protein [Cellulomonas sp. PhB143]|uniref:flavin reductase family protein n=1 Tax=Cellulomonas sp. PhB143 TaxID=2485186 RepID=UPI000F48B3BC|nr:flavin reductase family protein [Cellulomonas sp. PhB143]ROS75440.1 flavin reductase (DIM6/NTAB) family NADH-FMN oxidoreductase RutF [Cellulomonas sp. PhB143]
MTAVDVREVLVGVPVPAPAGVAPDRFRDVFRGHPAGVAVVTTRVGGQVAGFTATSVISVSAEPPLVAFSLARGSSSWPLVARASTVAISLLAEGQEEISTRFATSGIDRFAAGGWRPLASGEPVIDGAAAWLHADVVDRVAAGSSRLVVVRVVGCESWPGRAPLVFHDRGYRRLAGF